MQQQFWETVPKKKVYFKDCTEPLTDADFEIGQSRVVDSPIGSYRETGSVDNNRFGYRFQVENINKPHLMAVRYPDDKRRMLCVQDGVDYDLSMGLVLGGDMELTGTMQTAYHVFWPRATDQSVLISSFFASEPAAAASIEVFELEALPELPMETAPYPTRSFGIQYEDPCNIGASEGAQNYSTWTDRHIAFMKHTGQNRLVYPVTWYHGPTVPVKSQPTTFFNTLVMAENGTRKFFTRSVQGDYHDWLEDLLTKFDAEGFRFTGASTLMRLGNLMQDMNIEEDSVRAGADTRNSVLYTGQVQGTVNDWTKIYNVRNFPDWVKANGDMDQTPSAYGEHKTSDVAAPMFNLNHPEVRSQILDYFGEMAQRYAHHPSFEGLSINFWHGTILWFGNLLTGYDDYSAEGFTKDTGIAIPAEKGDPHRFEARYTWLMANAKEAWIAWRCQKVHELLLEVRDTIRAARKDLKLTLTVWNETNDEGLFPGVEGFPNTRQDPAAQYGVQVTKKELYRNGGLDFSLFANDENISVCVERDFCRDAIWRAEPGAFSRSLTDPMYLETGLFDTLKAANESEAFHFNCWEERWGHHTVFACQPEDEGELKKIMAMPDYTPTFVHRENCTYADDPEHKFFYDAELRITSMFPDEVNFMELLTADVALQDALSVTAGGLYLDKGHALAQRAFAAEYRRLPAKRFTDVHGVLDPVCMRYLAESGKTWVYAVNREPYAVSVSFRCAGRTESVTLAPYCLKTFLYDAEAAPESVTVTVPEERRTAYAEKLKTAVAALEAARNTAEVWGNGIPKILAELQEAAETAQYARLRHLLQCYVVCKAKE